MKMTKSKLCVELWPKMRLGYINLILMPKKAEYAATLAHPPHPPPPTAPPPLRNLRGFLQRSRCWLPSLETVKALSYYLEEGRTVNGTHYSEERRQLHQEIAKKTREKLTRVVLLLQDNAPAYTSQVAIAAAIKCSFASLVFSSPIGLLPVSKSEN